MDSFNNGSVWYSKLESEVLLTDLFGKLSNFPENEKAKVVTSWLANSFADLTNSGSHPQSDTGNCFVVHVKLVNNLVKNSSIETAQELAGLFSNDFLHAFVKPSLLDAPQHGDGPALATKYFQLVCDNITQPLLIRKVVTLVIVSLLPTLVSRLKSNDSEVLSSTLGLFRSLLEFYCEDIWHDLLLQYLLPMKHLIVSERQKAVPEINFQDSTTKFIDNIPTSIYGAVSQETLSEHFVVYIEQELQRIRSTDITISATIPLPRSQVTGIPLLDVFDVKEDASIEQSKRDDLTEDNNSRNAMFPMWVFKYDGTDVTYVSRKYKLSEPEEYFEDDFFQFFDKGNLSNIDEESRPSSSMRLPEDPGEAIRVYAEPVTLLHIRTPNPDPASTSFQSWKPVGEDQGYLGPFLESMFQILDKWTRLEPEVLLAVSDIFSVLASSRIPLISSILLDFSVVLQPCFPSFHSLIHSIKIRLDGSLKKYPDTFVQQEWKRATSGANNLLKDAGSEDLFHNPADSFAETLRLKILKSSLFVNRSSATNKLAKLFGSTPENRILQNSGSVFGNEEEELIARKSTLRCIIFAHWMLELSAIAQQSCWFQSRQNQRQREDDDQF